MSQSVLLDIARDSIKEVLESNRNINISALLKEHPILEESNPIFITLIYDDKLRGSSGALQSTNRLIDDIIYHAKIAAFEDTTFSPLSTSEYLHTSIDLSIISNLLHVKVDSFTHLVELIDTKPQGLCLKTTEKEAIFLPQFAVDTEILEQIYREYKNPEIYTFDVESAKDNAIL